MKKALIICTGAYYTDGGIAAVNRLTIQAVMDSEYALDVLVLPESDSQVGEQHISLAYQAHFSYQTYRGNKYVFTLAVWRAVLGGRYDLILVDHVNLASILAPLVWLKRCQYTVWLCGIEVFPPNPDFEGRLGMTNAAQCLAISDFTQKNVAARFPNLSISVCDLALDPARHPRELPAEPDCPSQTIFLSSITGQKVRLEDRVILHVGRMISSGTRYKGQESLLHAFPAVHQQHPRAQLVLIGQGEDMPQIRALAESLPAELQNGVFMPGYVSDQMLDQIYRSCFVFAMPSIGEGFGLVYLEAMSRGKACLGARMDATPYLIQEGVTGLLVDDARSSEQVGSKLIEMLDVPESTWAMGIAGYNLIRSKYLFHNFRERFGNALSEVR